MSLEKTSILAGALLALCSQLGASPTAAAAEDLDGLAAVYVECVAGPPSYLPSSPVFATASAYWPHYRWLKLDVYNPAETEVRVRVGGVPLVLHPGANTAAVKTVDAVAGGRGWGSAPV